MSKVEKVQARRGELELMNAQTLCSRMHTLNPFGGYAPPTTPDQRCSMIDTILRYEFGKDAA